MTQQVRPGVQQLIDAMENVPAFVQNGRLDIIASNRLGHAVFSEMYLQPQRPANFARFVFLDPRAGTKIIHHPVVGDLDLSYEAMDLTSDRGLLLVAYTAAPGSPSDDALRILMSWTATHKQADALATPDQT